MNMAIREGAARRFRTIWISDIHLGTRGCQAALLLDFLKHTGSETLYLVGRVAVEKKVEGLRRAGPRQPPPDRVEGRAHS